jgi:hypothetical protein
VTVPSSATAYRLSGATPRALRSQSRLTLVISAIKLPGSYRSTDTVRPSNSNAKGMICAPRAASAPATFSCRPGSVMNRRQPPPPAPHALPPRAPAACAAANRASIWGW